MEESKLFKWLRRLSTSEFDDFILFAKSPYHNKNMAIIPLVKYLKKYHPELRGTKVDMSLICRKIQAPKVVKQARLNVLMSQSLRLLEDFLTYETVKHNPLTFQRQQVIAYRDRQLDKAFTKSVKSSEDLLETQRKDQDYHFAKYQLNREVFYHPATPRQKVGQSGLEGALGHLDLFYAWEKMCLSVLAYNRQHILGEEYEFLLLNEVREICILRGDSDILQFMSDLIEFWKEKDLDLFKQLCVDYERLLPEFTEDEGQTYLQILLNFGVRLNREGHYRIIPSTLLLYKSGLESGLIYQNGNLTENKFFSICSTFSACGEYEEGMVFVKKHQFRIIPKSSEKEAFQLGKLSLLFQEIIQKKDISLFDETMENLSIINLVSSEYAFRVKSMQLRMHYEVFIQSSNNKDFIEHFTLAFERQIIRNSTLSYKKKSFLSFIKIMKKLIYYHSKPSIKLKNEILNLLNRHSGIAKKWLSEKIEEMN